MTPELEKFCELLETTEAQQAIGIYRWTRADTLNPEIEVAYCATGLFFENIRKNDPLRFQWYGSHFFDKKTGKTLGWYAIDSLLGIAVSSDVVHLNDSGMGFKEIAAYLRRRFA